MKTIYAILSISVLTFLLACSSAKEQTKMEPLTPAEPALQLNDPLPLNSKILEGKLDNGLRYFIRKNSKPENRAELRLVVNAGSILESDDQLGLAHFVEHMAFNGTKHFQKQELINFLESIGMRFGPDINAYTSFDETVYMLQIPTDSVEIVNNAFLVLQDWASGVSFDGEEIDKERGVIIEEWRLGRGAQMRMLDEQLPVILKDSHYADRLPIGKKDILDNFTHDRLRQFYKDWYRPDLMAVIVVGDFDVQTMKKKVEKHFGSIPVAKEVQERKYFSVPGHDETLFTIASDPEATNSMVQLYHKLPAEKEETVADYRRMIVERLYNAMLNQRFQELLKQESPPFIYAYSNKGKLVRTSSTYILAAMAKDTEIPMAMETLLTEAKRVKMHGFTSSEFERIKKNVLRSMEKAYAERDKSESRGYASELIRHFLEDEPAPGIEFEYEVYKQFLPDIKLAEVNALAKKWISESNRVIAVNSPEKEGLEIPTDATLQAVLTAVNAKSIEPYVDEVVTDPLISSLPTAGSIMSESTINELGVTELNLSNGIRVLLKPTDFKNDEIRFRAFSPGGTSLVADTNLVAAQTAASVIREGGVAGFDQIQLQKLLAGKVVSVNPVIGNLTEGISGQASPQDIETMFQLIYLKFTAPRRDSTAFASLKTRIEGFYQNQSVDPESAFEDTITVSLTSYHPRYQPFGLERIDEMDIDKSMAIFKDRFADAGDFTFIFVGNFTIDQMKPFLEQYVASLPTTGREETWSEINYQLPKGIVEKEVKKGMEAKSLVSMYFYGPFEWNSENRSKLQTMTSALRIKLRERLREDKSGTYFVRVNSSTDHYPDQRYEITIAFGCNPDRVEELTAEVFTQIDSVKQFGLPEKYLNKVKEIGLRSYETDLKENRWWLSKLESAYFHGLDPLGILKVDELIQSRKIEEIQQTANKYFDTNNYLRVVLYPEQMASAGGDN